MARYCERFIPGQTYFIVMFQDEAMTVPVVQTLTYERASPQDGDVKNFLFREVPIDGEGSIVAINKEHAEHLILDKEELLTKLTSCLHQQTE